jgi:hypothetical protein
MFNKSKFRYNICKIFEKAYQKNVLYLEKKIQFWRIKYSYMNKYLAILGFIVVFVLSPTFVQTAIAQPPPIPPEEIPIDGGLGFLLAAGVAYAAKRLYKNRDQEA